MRYQIGEQLPVIHVAYKGDTNRARRVSFSRFFATFNEVERITLNVLTVIEHHKVRSDYDEPDAEPEYDGYILVDREGRRYYNQYPTASYSQTGDSSDRLFKRDVDSNFPSMGAFLNSGEIYSYGLLASDFGDTYGIIESISRDGKATESVSAYREYMAMVKIECAKQLNMDIIIEPITFTHAGVTEILPGHYTARFVLLHVEPEVWRFSVRYEGRRWTEYTEMLPVSPNHGYDVLTEPEGLVPVRAYNELRACYDTLKLQTDVGTTIALDAAFSEIAVLEQAASEMQAEIKRLREKCGENV